MANLRERLQKLGTDEAIRLVAEIRPQAFAQVAELRATHLKGRRELSDKSRDGYAADARRVEAGGGDPADLAGTAGSFRKLRAACLWRAREELAEALARADRARKKAGGSFAGDAAALCVYDAELPGIVAHLEFLESCKFDPQRVERRCRTKMQRHKLGRLPVDWIARINARAQGRRGDGKYRHAVAVATLVPVRPAEIAARVRVRTLDGGRLLFQIHGSKVQDHGAGVAAHVAGIGQEWREIVLERVDASRQQVFDYLWAEALAAGGALTVGKGMTAGGISSAFCSMSAREFENYAAPPSFYALRHSACAEMKEAAGAQSVAKAMGHQSERSQQAYGTRRQGSGGYSFAANASDPVRPARPKIGPPSVSRKLSKAGRRRVARRRLRPRVRGADEPRRSPF